MLNEITNVKNKKLTYAKYERRYLRNQKISAEINRLEANIGDMVYIIWPGKGKYCYGFDCSKPHMITNITPSGFVEFDHGNALSLSPDVININRYMPERRAL